MRVAVLGGTGSFGKALAVRLVALGEDQVVIGSRDAARAQATASELGGGAVGATNEDALRDVALAVLAVKADGALDTARAIADALGETPLLSVASAIEFSKDGVRCDPDVLSLAERIQQVVRGPVVAGLHSIGAANLDVEPPDEDALICGDDAVASSSLSISQASSSPGARSTPGRAVRALEGLTAVIVNVNRLQGARRHAHHGPRS